MSNNLDFDPNINNYTLSELIAITNINNLSKEEIINKTNDLIKKSKNNNQEKLVSFFNDIRQELLRYIDVNVDNNKNNNIIDYDNNGNNVDVINVEGFGNMENDYVNPNSNEQTSDWYREQHISQDDEIQNSKNTDRSEKIDIYGNSHVPMKKEELGINDTYSVPVKQGSLNPNLKNKITRFVNIDSQFRQNSVNNHESTNYTLDLSDRLKNVLSLRLYSYQIPYNWYTIDKSYGNTCFWITDISTNTTVTISLESGNYTHSEFVESLNKSFEEKYFTFEDGKQPVTYNVNNGKITLHLFNGYYNNNNISFTINENTIVTFFDENNILYCDNNCYNKSKHFINNTLGWIMGFRSTHLKNEDNFNTINQNGNTSDAILDLNGTKYLTLIIDDYNQNHVNNAMVSITELSNIVQLPTYYNYDMPYNCNSNIQNILPSAPRTLTQSQLYTVNEILQNRKKQINVVRAPTNSEILAVIPIKKSGLNTGDLLVDLTGPLQDNIRTYFGPVNIDRMAIKLMDDKGNILNLNDTNWCVTLICECLYQY